MTSVPGVAQRTGATNYYVELFPKHGAKANSPAPVLGLTPVPGDVDIVIASELMEAGRAVQRGLVTPDRTTFIVSTNRVYSMTERIALADGRVDSERAAGRLPGRGQAHHPRRHGATGRSDRQRDLSRAVRRARRRQGAADAAHGVRGRDPSRRRRRQGKHRGVRRGLCRRRGRADAGQDRDACGAARLACAGAADGRGRRLCRAGADVRAIAGIERLADYQDVAYARDYLDRLKPIAEIDKRHGNGSGNLLAETARELALGMAYEDTVRVAELKIRPSRFERVRAEVQAADGQIVEIAEFLHPRVQEIADTLPAGLGRWLLDSRLGAALRRAVRQAGRVVKTSSIRGFLQLYFIASLKPTRRRSLRFANEQAFLRDWLRTIETVAATNYALATEIATTRTLVKGYSDTHERGRRRYDMLMQMLPRIMETPDPAATLAGLRKAALGRRHRRGAQCRDQGFAPAAASGGINISPSSLSLRDHPSPAGGGWTRSDSERPGGSRSNAQHPTRPRSAIASARPSS